MKACVDTGSYILIMNLVELKQLTMVRNWLKSADLTVTQADGSEIELEEMIALPVQLGKCKVNIQ